LTVDNLPPIANTDPITGQRLFVSFEEHAAPLHPGAQQLLAYWNACQVDGGFVMGRDVPTRSIASLTKNLIVLEPVQDQTDFRFRLVGQALRDRFGRDVAGLLISEVYDEPTTQSFQSALRKVVDTQRPVFQVVHVTGALGDVRKPETVLLPMKAADELTSWILCGLFYHY
jgi:hypothetical protein